MAEARDIPEILHLCEQHHDSVPFGALPFSRKKVAQVLDVAVTGDKTKACLFVSTAGSSIVGVFLAVVSEVTFSEEPVASELAFWLLPKYRKSRRVLDLIGAYEYWAKNIAKVNYAILSSTPEVDGTERSYSRLGYALIEKNYLKKIG